jgi:hypothetical protein
MCYPARHAHLSPRDHPGGAATAKCAAISAKGDDRTLRLGSGGLRPSGRAWRDPDELNPPDLELALKRRKEVT